jgi:hypothetical protein
VKPLLAVNYIYQNRSKAKYKDQPKRGTAKPRNKTKKRVKKSSGKLQMRL